MSTPGILYVVATPIGNLQDITYRAINIFKYVDIIAVEDTRYSKKLMQHYGITTAMISLHNYNEINRTKVIIKKLGQGQNIALISDAGTPVISDPGFYLIRAVLSMGYKVTPIPGVCAAIAALCVSGMPAHKFIFEGFLPSKQIQQLKRLQELFNENRTIIIYESSHRLITTISNIHNIYGDNREIVLAKELTKIFETIHITTTKKLKEWLFEKHDRKKGEFVILIKGTITNISNNYDHLHILHTILQYLPKKESLTLTAKLTGISKNKLYENLLKADQEEN